MAAAGVFHEETPVFRQLLFHGCTQALANFPGPALLVGFLLFCRGFQTVRRRLSRDLGRRPQGSKLRKETRMKIYPPFPTCREATPTRRAEKLIYEALEASELDGLALYEVKPLSSAPQLDFAVWLLDVGTFGIQTKGGRYIIIDGEWYLVTDHARQGGGYPMGVGQLSESDAVDALRLPFYSSSHPTGSHGWRNQFDLGNPDYIPPASPPSSDS